MSLTDVWAYKYVHVEKKCRPRPTNVASMVKNIVLLSHQNTQTPLWLMLIGEKWGILPFNFWSCGWMWLEGGECVSQSQSLWGGTGFRFNGEVSGSENMTQFAGHWGTQDGELALTWTPAQQAPQHMCVFVCVCLNGCVYTRTQAKFKFTCI